MPDKGDTMQHLLPLVQIYAFQYLWQLLEVALQVQQSCGTSASWASRKSSASMKHEGLMWLWASLCLCEVMRRNCSCA